MAGQLRGGNNVTRRNRCKTLPLQSYVKQRSGDYRITHAIVNTFSISQYGSDPVELPAGVSDIVATCGLGCIQF